MKRLVKLFLPLALLAAGSAQAACEFEIDAGADLAFSVTEMEVEQSCGEVTVTLNNTSSLPAAAMGHNWVLTKAGDLEPVAVEGQEVGLENDYVKSDDDRVLAYTSIVGGGETTEVTFSVADLEVGGAYKFFCSFPGHWAVMQGDLIVS